MRVGVLALQGGFAAHGRILERLNIEAVEVRDATALDGLDGLVLPGGESTAQRRLIEYANLGPPLDDFVASGRPLLATCAGAITAAERQWVDAEFERNAWGRQRASFDAEVIGPGMSRSFDCRFIRAPRCRSVGRRAVALSWTTSGKNRGEVVAVKQSQVLVMTGHPELCSVDVFHAYVFGTG